MADGADDDPMCCDCKFWRSTQENDYLRVGECKRRAPSPVMLTSVIHKEPDFAPVWHIWPETESGDWCGEYEAGHASPA